jgi:hypothetical protein
VIAPRVPTASELEFGDGKQQQQHPQQLKQERERLLNSTAPCNRSGLPRLDPEAKRRNNLITARAIEQVKRDGKRAYNTEYRDELPEGKVKKFHVLVG